MAGFCAVYCLGLAVEVASLHWWVESWKYTFHRQTFQKYAALAMDSKFGPFLNRREVPDDLAAAGVIAVYVDKNCIRFIVRTNVGPLGPTRAIAYFPGDGDRFPNAGPYNRVDWQHPYRDAGWCLIEYD